MKPNKESKNRNRKMAAIIAFNVFLIACTLAGGVTGTIAWFQTNRSFETEASSFGVVGRSDIEFDFYYLDHFTVETNEKYGNYNRYDASHGKFAGYEVSYSNATFVKAEMEDGEIIGNPNPANITDLWPAHMLTFAIVINHGQITQFSLTDWDEVTNSSIKVQVGLLDIPISISWATNMYGKAYSVQDTGEAGITADEVNAKYGEATTGYHAQFSSLLDKFPYHETNRAPDEKEELVIVDSVPSNDEGYNTVLFFTLEFSNDSSTWYRQDGDYFVQDSTSGNSNCYENLQLNNLKFTIK